MKARPTPETLAAVTAELQALFGNRAVTSEAVRQQHGHTLTVVPNQPPDIVVYPRDVDDCVAVMKLAARHGVPVVPFGTGTSLEGHVNAPYGGISVDTSLMKAIVAVHAEDLDVVVEPGVTRKQLNDYLRDMGLFFPIDPGADASIGGMASTRASGTNAVRYGTMKDNVIALEVVLPNGEVIETARRAKKSSAGYDLTHLFVGAEGTLGLITKITLKLHGIPEAISAAVCSFPTVKAAADTTIAAIQSGIPVARIELLDEVQVKAVNTYSKLSLPESPLLLLEFHGTDAGVAEQVERFRAIADDYGAGNFEWAVKPEDRSRLWQARHDSYWAALALRPGTKSQSSDVCVPLSRLADCIEETKRDIEATGLVAPIVGHVGDGNFHVLPLMDENDPEDVARVTAFMGRIVERALAMGGTCTGEHGVGQGKMKYLKAEHGGPALALMAALKQAVDPAGIMNPGKIIGA
ncbi:FAD-binding oxidoreductase [Phreatobacter sp. AB_2022a]|uniref:FAD-binding oxidoreductase n=1 Tax=Phreatobacter sp. AB_2022a TaxID=3003134 RepID=UPI002286DE5B|nr:FAD-linked oxidase C-terminal domain-containing protein [Phreatobacter sp. AB_2022a]MCZ0738193.1 FAD-binding protein [Phreatobacter sp. AB_2022a]